MYSTTSLVQTSTTSVSWPPPPSIKKKYTADCALPHVTRIESAALNVLNPSKEESLVRFEDLSDSEDERAPVYPPDFLQVMAGLHRLSCTPPESPRSEAPLSSDSPSTSSSPAPRSVERPQRDYSSRGRHYSSWAAVAKDFESAKNMRPLFVHLTPHRQM